YSIEDGTNVAALAFHRVAGSTSGDGAVVEQNLTTLRIACGNFHFLNADARDFVNTTKQGERVVQERIVGIGGDAWKLGDDGLDFGNGREPGKIHKRNFAREQIRILNHRTAEEEQASSVVRRQRANRISAQCRVFIEQRLLMRVFVERADSFQRPEGVNRAG